MTEATKQCCRCTEVKPLCAYYAQGGACKTCTAKRQRELYAARTPEQIEKKRKSVKAFAKNNWDKLLEKAREQNKKPQRKEWVQQYREENKDRIKASVRDYYLRNQERMREFQNEWQKVNPEKIKEYYRRYMSQPEVRERSRSKSKNYRDQLPDGYVRTLLSLRTVLAPKAIPSELVKVKQIQLQIRKAIKNGANTGSESEEEGQGDT